MRKEVKSSEGKGERKNRGGRGLKNREGKRESSKCVYEREGGE